MLDELLNIFSGVFIVLKALTQEQDGFQSQLPFDGLTEAVVTGLHFPLELFPVLGVEGGHALEQFEQDNADGPNVGLVGVHLLLDDLWGHIKRRPADGPVDLILGLELFRKPEISDLNFKSSFRQVYICKELLLLVFAEAQ